jgi:hypothetical protein
MLKPACWNKKSTEMNVPSDQPLSQPSESVRLSNFYFQMGLWIWLICNVFILFLLKGIKLWEIVFGSMGMDKLNSFLHNLNQLLTKFLAGT